MIRWLWQVLLQQIRFDRVDGRERLELELHVVHQRTKREEARQISETRAILATWEARGGRQAWEEWVDRERARIELQTRAASLG